MNHISYVVLKERQSPRHFALPLIHLFWGTSEQKQKTYYYHLLVLQNEFSLRAIGDYPGLTTKEWRSILGNYYWKTMWPKPSPNDVGSPIFNPMRFWIHGGPLFFGSVSSAQVASGVDISSVLLCGCEVKVDSADDDEVRQTVLYHLNMNHATAEIREMDHLQFPLDYRRWWEQGCLSPVRAMTDMWGPCRDGRVKSGFFEDRKAWRAWLEAAHEVVMDWEEFDEWDWDSITDIRIFRINNLEAEVFFKLAVRILAFFIHSFITRLGYYPSPMLCPPILAGPQCAKHRKKSATGPF